MTYDDQIYQSLLPLLIVNIAFLLVFYYFVFTWTRRQLSPEVLERLHHSFVGVFFRELWQWITDPIVKVLVFFKITPNVITLFSIVLSLITGYLYAVGQIAWGGWFLVISGTMDMLDGRVARVANQVTRSGAFLDSCTDRYTDAFVFAGIGIYFVTRNYSTEAQSFSFVGFELIMLMVTLLVLIGSSAMSYVKARGEATGFSTKRGLMQRPERITMLAVTSAIHPFFSILATKNNLDRDISLIVVLILMCILINFSTFARFISIFRDIRRTERA